MAAYRRVLVVVGTALACAVGAASAGATLKIAAWTSGERLSIARDGSALITWREAGRTRRAVVRGDRIRYRGRVGRARIGRHVRPAVAYGIAQVVLPDGTRYALQRVRRLGQLGHVGAPELRFSRWHGTAPQLRLTAEWVYGGRFPRICGTATYHGRPFYGGPHTLTERPLDAFGRNVYIDVRRRGGWFRIMGVLTRPRGFALLIRESRWRGARYRALVPGPNVEGDLAPDVTAATAMPAAKTAGACPFATGAYRHA